MFKLFCENIKNAMQRRKQLAVMLLCLLLTTAGCLVLQEPIQTLAAQNVTSLEQMEKVFRQSIKKGKDTISFHSSNMYTTAQIQNELNDAAKTQNRLLAGSIQITRQTESTGRNRYKIELSKDALMKVRVLKSESAAVKAAAKILKTGKYSANFYSDKSYYDVFHRILQQHPEFNYDTSVWRSSNGAYGYHRSASLTKAEQESKMEAAARAAQEAVKKCIKSGMSDRKKAKAIHDYIINNCRYLNAQDSFTAYGALVNGTAVCQGYAAAFNLMAGKCGLMSMTVCGTARGGAHAWNYVKIGNRYRYIDCTWDDTGMIGKGIIYNYFSVTARKMQLDHIWNKKDFPSKDIKYYKYFV